MALVILGNSITTDHISPAGSIKLDSPAGKYLSERQINQNETYLLADFGFAKSAQMPLKAFTSWKNCSTCS